jgi:hypothetical protein
MGWCMYSHALSFLTVRDVAADILRSVLGSLKPAGCVNIPSPRLHRQMVGQPVLRCLILLKTVDSIRWTS